MANQTSTAILEEMVELSITVIKFCQNSDIPSPIANQATRSVSSIGANFSEAQDASSRKDFINKIYIAKKEASETKYWLIIIAKLSGQPNDVIKFSERAQKFIMMLQKIINTSRESNRKSPTANPSPMGNRQWLI